MKEHDNPVPSLPDYGMKILDYFYPNGDPSRQKVRDDYLSRGLIPTNNLSVYIVDEPKAEIAPDIPNPFDYCQQPFGSVIENLKLTQVELWEEAKTIKEECEVSMRNFIDLLNNKEPIGPEVFIASDKLQLRKSEVFDKVIRIIAPQLLEKGIDPLDLCK